MFAFFIHAHTDCSDALEMCLGQLKKYFPNHKIHIAINKPHALVEGESFLLYDENDSYTVRLKKALSKIEDEFVLYMHEDMILFDTPDYEELDRCLEFIKDKAQTDCIKLIATTGIADEEVAPSIRVQHGSCSFSVQPTIWKRESFVRLVTDLDYSIWELEENIQDKFRSEFIGYTYYTGEESLRGMAHFDSHIFPYTATAIIKGKWNNLEYSSELAELWEEYNTQSEREMYDYDAISRSL